MKTLSVVVPVYFNAESLPALLQAFQEVELELARRDMRIQLIFVDDGSQDDSLFRLLDIKKARPETVVVKLSRNFGAMQALKTGFKYVTGDCFVCIAADLQDHPRHILPMVDAWLEGAKVVMSVRAERDDPPMTRLFAFIYYKLVRWLVSKDYPNGGFDLALMDKQLLPYFRESGKNLNISLMAYWLGFKPVVIPYKRERRPHGKSRWTFSKKLKHLIDSFVGFSFAPIRMISLVGLIIALLSMAYGVFQVVMVFLFGSPLPGFPTLAALLAFLFSLVIMMLGVLGEYLWRILDEVNHRPESVIDEVYN